MLQISEIRKPLAAFSLLVLFGLAWAAVTEFRSRSSSRLQNPDAAAVSTGFADEASCAECHDQAEEFSRTGHARTLVRADAPESLELLRQFVHSTAPQAEGTSLSFADGKVTAVSESTGVRRTATLDWCFGSGTHACTWVTTLPDSRGRSDALEFRWTWFSQTASFGLTPGQPDQPGNSAVSALGLLFDEPKARRCFFCHATSVPITRGRIQEDAIHAGVTCQRCHGPRAQHVLTEGASTPEGWKLSDRNDEVRRCAVCHRFSEERDPHDIVADNPAIVRFQPMGLLQSRCFIQSEMRCTTCHDPHRPMDKATSRNINQCVQCHSPDDVSQTTCGKGETDRCLDCHMPQVQMNFPVRFTDHWIRVIRGSDQGHP